MNLAELSRPDRVRENDPRVSVEAGDTLRHLATRLIDGGRSLGDAAKALVVPGRIELLGKHTDYAGGRSLTCATEQGFRVVAVKRDDRRVEIEDALRGERTGFELTLQSAQSAELDTSASNWVRYVKTVARRLARDFGGDLCGADIAFASDLPPASGMSSSSALVVTIFQALAAVNELESRDDYRNELGDIYDLAGYLGAVENGYSYRSFGADAGVGRFGGSEDHTAILCSVEGSVGQYSYAPVRRERTIAVPPEHVFVVASSGVRARKAGEARELYNRCATLASEAARLWREATGGVEPNLAAIFAADPDALAKLREVVSAHPDADDAVALRRRVDHFHQENEMLVPQAGDALEAEDLAVFGLVVDRSQHLGRELLGNQIPETLALAEAAREMGAVAASAFGAGFGGAVWSLVAESEADEFAESWLDDYLEAFPEHERAALALVTGASGPAFEVGG